MDIDHYHSFEQLFFFYRWFGCLDVFPCEAARLDKAQAQLLVKEPATTLKISLVIIATHGQFLAHLSNQQRYN